MLQWSEHLHPKKILHLPIQNPDYIQLLPVINSILMIRLDQIYVD